MRPKTVTVADGDYLMTPDDVAALLHTSRAAIDKMVERGQCPARVVIRLGRKLYFHRASLLDWRDQMRAAARLAQAWRAKTQD